MQKSVIPKQQQYRLVLVDTWWYWVSMEWYWLIYDGTGSVWGNTWSYLVVLDQYRAVLVDKDAVLGDWAVYFDSAVTWNP